MGAWGPHALDSDQALDWLGNEVTDPAGEKIRDLIDRFNKRVESEGGEAEYAVSELGMQLRAAAYVVIALNFFNERLHGDLHGDLAAALQQIHDCDDWIDEWSGEDEVRASLTEQIEKLRAGPESTTLFANLDA
jgi:hypothetical protein